MRVIGAIADRMLSMVAPKTTAAALCTSGWVDVNCYCRRVGPIEIQYKKSCWRNVQCAIGPCYGACFEVCECGSC